MYSNNSPYGVAKSSSSLSSTYFAWKAFDGEDESGGWSRWISQPTGTFTEEWISYEFNNPVTIMAYSITPETGGSITRTPSQWKVQGWNGQSWKTLDSRTGYSIADWESNNNRQFIIQYPEKFKKYRLLVEDVNGSDVVSIRKFKIFGKNEGDLKSEEIDLFSSDFSSNGSTLESGIDIHPNPNNGIFKIKINDLQSYLDQGYMNSDSLRYNNSTKFDFNNPSINSNEDILVEIFDVTSNKVYEIIVNEDMQTIDVNLGDMEKGLYILKATINGREKVIKKFIIN
jgi:hypothetical protein